MKNDGDIWLSVMRGRSRSRGNRHGLRDEKKKQKSRSPKSKTGLKQKSSVHIKIEDEAPREVSRLAAPSSFYETIKPSTNQTRPGLRLCERFL